jgi:hypothetical protein
MATVIVNESTSVIQAAEAGVVYISSSAVPGHIATVLDQTGSGNPLLLSTTSGITLTGISTIQQPFGYLTLQALTSTSWTVVNQYPFADLAATNIRALDAFNVTATALDLTTVSTGTVGTRDIECNSVVASTTGACSTVAIGVTASGTAAASALYVSQRMKADSDLASVGPVTATGSLHATLSLTVGGSAYVSSNVAIGRNIIAPAVTVSTISAGRVSTTSVFCSSSIFASTLAVNTVSTGLLNAKGDGLTFSTLVIGPLYIGSDTVSAPIVSTYPLYTNTVTATDSHVDSIRFKTYYGPDVSTIELYSAVITNTYGSLSTSDVSANFIRFNRIFCNSTTTSTISLNTMTLTPGPAAPVNLLLANGDTLTLDSYWAISGEHITAGNIRTSNFSVIDGNANELRGYQVTAETLTLNSFAVGTSATFNGPSFYTPMASIIDTSGSVTTGPAFNTSTATVNHIQGISSINGPPLTVPAIYTPALYAVDISASGLVSTPVVTGKCITLGQPLSVQSVPHAVFEIFSDDYYVNTITPPFQTAQGSGSFRDPFTAFNVFNTLIYLSFSNPTGQPLYLNISLRHTNLGSTTGGLSVSVNGNRIYSIQNSQLDPVLTYALNDIPVASYPIVAPNPITQDYTTPWFSWGVDAGGETTDQIVVWISNKTVEQDMASPSVLNPENGIKVNSGVLKWPSTIFGTTIHNRFNDIQTRSLLYTGSLRNLSDRSIKQEIESADLSQCAQTLEALPLRRYSYIPAYMDAFQVNDTRRLGILSTELATPFPKSIRRDILFDQQIDTVNTEQLKFAHLGATKFLMEEVARLKRTLSGRTKPVHSEYTKPVHSEYTKPV